MMTDYDDFARIVIVGGPRCGKTTLSNRFTRPVWHTDDMILDSLRMSAASVAAWLDWEPPWVIEGVTATLAVAEWLRIHGGVGSDGYPVGTRTPCDIVLCLWSPMLRLTVEQQSMLRYLRSRWGSARSELLRRGVPVRDVVVQRTYDAVAV